MDLAVTSGRREREQVLRVELVSRAGKRGAQIVAAPDLASWTNTWWTCA